MNTLVLSFSLLNIATTNFLHYRIENTNPAQPMPSKFPNFIVNPISLLSFIRPTQSRKNPAVQIHPLKQSGTPDVLLITSHAQNPPLYTLCDCKRIGMNPNQKL